MPVGPYSQDVLTRIVNVSWGGLAVIFGKQAEDAVKQDNPTLRKK